ncbi:MAG: hypothetical protein SW833_15520 [Cyanobacteriota bacterium]|nr:hypothetical protein [Cyanobacteriota bacterium]
MNTPFPSESNPDKINARDAEISLEMLQEQCFNLKISVEELQHKVDRLRGLLQTLVMGLVIAVLLTIGISGWFAYRLLVQEQIARRAAERSTVTNAEMLERIEEMEAQLQRQKQQLQTFKNDVPDELEFLSETVRANQQQLKLLRDRVESTDPDEDSTN